MQGITAQKCITEKKIWVWKVIEEKNTVDMELIYKETEIKVRIIIIRFRFYPLLCSVISPHNVIGIHWASVKRKVKIHH